MYFPEVLVSFSRSEQAEQHLRVGAGRAARHHAALPQAGAQDAPLSSHRFCIAPRRLLLSSGGGTKENMGQDWFITLTSRGKFP